MSRLLISNDEHTKNFPTTNSTSFCTRCHRQSLDWKLCYWKVEKCIETYTIDCLRNGQRALSHELHEKKAFFISRDIPTPFTLQWGTARWFMNPSRCAMYHHHQHHTQSTLLDLDHKYNMSLFYTLCESRWKHRKALLALQLLTTALASHTSAKKRARNWKESKKKFVLILFSSRSTGRFSTPRRRKTFKPKIITRTERNKKLKFRAHRRCSYVNQNKSKSAFVLRPQLLNQRN